MTGGQSSSLLSTFLVRLKSRIPWNAPAMIERMLKKSHSIFFSIRSTSSRTSKKSIVSVDYWTNLISHNNFCISTFAPLHHRYKVHWQACERPLFHFSDELLLAPVRPRNNAVVCPFLNENHLNSTMFAKSNHLRLVVVIGIVLCLVSAGCRREKTRGTLSG